MAHAALEVVRMGSSEEIQAEVGTDLLSYLVRMMVASVDESTTMAAVKDLKTKEAILQLTIALLLIQLPMQLQFAECNGFSPFSAATCLNVRRGEAAFWRGLSIRRA